jgi:regulator of protease activity HflC (stomatin/prohibitin superfamily)
MLLLYILIPVIAVILISIKQINEYERGVRFSFGRYSGIMEPGWKLVFPVIQSYQRVDIRIKAVDVPDQEAITQDNVSARINAVIYYRVIDAPKAILSVQQFQWAVLQLAQTTMRNVVGETSLDDLLSKRQQIATHIEKIVETTTDTWGIKVESVELKDILLPDDMRRVIGRQAEAERERRAIIIRAEGEKAAADNIAAAAATLAETPGGLHIRTLQTLNEVGAEKNNTIVFAAPIELLRAMEGFFKK